MFERFRRSINERGFEENPLNVLDHQDPAQILQMVSLGVTLDQMNQGVGWRLDTYFSAFNAKREFVEGLNPVPEQELEMFLFELTRDGYLQGFMHREGGDPNLRVAPDGFQKALDHKHGFEEQASDGGILDS